MRLLLVLFLLGILALAGTVYGIRTGAIPIQPEWNPWAVLDIDAQPNFLTRYKLSRLNAAHRDHFHFDRGPYRVCR